MIAAFHCVSSPESSFSVRTLGTPADGLIPKPSVTKETPLVSVLSSVQVRSLVDSRTPCLGSVCMVTLEALALASAAVLADYFIAVIIDRLNGE